MISIIAPVFWIGDTIYFWVAASAALVAFMISGVVTFVRPQLIFDNLATWATITTLIGAVCFFVAAYLMWPEMGA